MNSEELELSLRNEFESHLKNTLADMRQEVVQFQEKLEAEFEKHKAQLDEVFQEFSARFAAEKQLDAGFTETVVEHLRLARDEGSRVAVAAMEKAEALQAEAEPPVPKAGVKELRDAISDISTKTTQSSILKTLVHYAAEFTPRGAFFIIKNEHLVGWRVFGNAGNTDEEAVREVFFPVAAETVLGESVRSLSAVESSYGSFSDDSIYLNKLEFGHPERMYAMPLVVRGRSVAVLYADKGNEGKDVNVEALETLARVASLTVEVLASARFAKSSGEAEKAHEIEESGSLENKYVNFEKPSEVAETETQTEAETEVQEESSEAAFVMTQTETVEEVSEQFETPAEEVAEQFETPVEEVSEVESAVEEVASPVEEFSEVAETEMPAVEEFSEIEEDETPSFEMIESSEEVQDFSTEPSSIEIEETPAVEEPSYFEPVSETPVFTEEYTAPNVNEYEPAQDYKIENDYQFESSESFEPAETNFEEAEVKSETPVFESAGFEFTTRQAEEVAPVQTDFNGYETESFKAETPVSEPVETVSQPVVASTPPTRSRFSDRNVDLPIEVGEEERRLHNDARRFARLLVSEIKLYNEQKVKEGREASDLYERLREAIDRSREMYDKRVQPPVAARFDYFHYEVVNTLAEGDENKLGAGYPGTTV